MFPSRITYRSWQTALLVGALGSLLTCASEGKAGIICPAPVSYDEADLDRALTGSAASSGTSAPQNSDSAPLNHDEQRQSRLRPLKAIIPSQDSSSSSSSSAGGAAGSGAAAYPLSNAAVSADDSLLGRLAEQRGLMLPDPCGTDLLRPPRAA
jgi:hypothetical protein